MKTQLCLLLLLAFAGYASASLGLFQNMFALESGVESDVPTDKNFTIDSFVGTWNVVALYGFPAITARTCPVLDVKKSITNTLTLTLESNNYTSSNFDVIKNIYQPDPLNKAILLDITDPVGAKNYAVSFYNETAGLALLINMKAGSALALSKADNVYANMFLETVNDILNEAGIPLNSTTLVNHFGCGTTYSSIATLNISSLPGTYYGNAIFTNSPLLADLSCYSISIQKESGSAEVYNITEYLQYGGGVIFPSSTNYAPSPVNEGLLIDIDNDLSASLVINYYDANLDAYALLAHDGSYAYVISSQKTLQASTLDSISNILKAQGLNVTSNNFITIPNACQI